MLKSCRRFTVAEVASGDRAIVGKTGLRRWNGKHCGAFGEPSRQGAREDAGGVGRGYGIGTQ
jgi:hypothetical protein